MYENNSRLPPQRWVCPAVAPFDPGHPQSKELIHERLLALRSDDSNHRVNAFNGLRAVPRELVRESWTRTRWQLAPAEFQNDCLHRVFVQKPAAPLVGERAFESVVSAGYEEMLRALLDSLALRGNCEGVPFVVFCVGNETFQTVSHWPDATPILCHAHERLSPAVKGVIYSLSRWLDFDSVVALEADMLVVDDLNSLFEQVERGHPNTIHGARHQAQSEAYLLSEVLGHMNAPKSDLEWLTGRDDFDCLFFQNGGVMAGSRAAWKALDAGFESLSPFVSMWVEGAFHEPFADEFAMNLVLGLSPKKLSFAELAPAFNTQIIDANIGRWVSETPSPSGARFSRMGEPARVLHFIAEKARQLEMLSRLSLPAPDAASMAVAPTTKRYRCRVCGFQTSCGSCVAPGTVAAESLASGQQSVLDRVCQARRDGWSEERIDNELRELAVEIKAYQNRAL